MTRNLKLLGLTVVAMLAIAVVGASAAAAAEFHSEASSTELEGEQAASFNDKFTVDAGTTECENATYGGTVSGATTTTATVTAAYSGCTSTFGVSVTVEMNGCEYLFHTGTENTADVVCPKEKVIVVNAPGCKITVFPQTARKTVVFETVQSVTPKHITVFTELTGVEYEEHNQGFFPTCKTNTGGKKKNGTYKGKETVKGKAGGKQVSIWYE